MIVVLEVSVEVVAVSLVSDSVVPVAVEVDAVVVIVEVELFDEVDCVEVAEVVGPMAQ